MKKYIQNTVFLLSVIGSSALNAAQNSGDALRESHISLPPEKKSVLPSVEYKVTESKHLFHGEEKILIKAFAFIGNYTFPSEVLESLLGEYRNKELSFIQIDEAVSKITDAYRKEGYFVARAYIPVQEIKDGVLTLGIIEGKYGEVRIQNNTPINSDVIQCYADAIDKNSSIRIQDVERAVLLIEDVPRTHVSSARLSAGTAVGSSDLNIDVIQDSIVDGYAFADNYGSRYTGYNRFSFGANLNSIWYQGEKITFGGLVSDTKGLESGHVDFEKALGGSGFKPRISIFSTTYELGKEDANLNAHGNATGTSVGASYPLLKTRLQTVVLDTEIKHQNLADFIDATNHELKKQSNTVRLGLSWSKEHMLAGMDGQTTSTLSWTTGKVKFIDSAEALSDANGAHLQGHFDKINFDATRLFRIENNINLSVYFRGQHVIGKKNLDGSEELSIAGANGVRFFSPSEQNGDNGYVYGAELFYALGGIENMHSTVSMFTDSGRAWQDIPMSSDIQRSLHDIGIGYYADYKSFFAKAFIAKEIGNAQILSDKGYETKFLAQAGLVF
jgi:hemolysin activation/secretion protein